MLHHFLHWLGHDVMPPALVAVGTAVVSVFAGTNWATIAGLGLSAGWFVLGVLRYRLDREKFEAMKPESQP